MILIDEGSASASEVVCGAIQDWDRGVIIGRRSFGKGLVQQPFQFNDGSIIRLTTARYFTPSGRNIQKPYMDYKNDYSNRFKNGEMVNSENIHFSDSLMKKTLVTRRNVYGGGGIMPDIFVPMDTSSTNVFLSNLSRKSLLIPFALNYLDKNKVGINNAHNSFEAFRLNFNVDDNIVGELIRLAVDGGIQLDTSKLSFDSIKSKLKAIIAMEIYGMNEFYMILSDDDPVVNKAIEILSSQRKYNSYLGK